MPLPWLTFVHVKTTGAARRSALSTDPIEALDQSSSSVLWVTGGAQTKGALPATTDRFEGAVYSSRGRGYARYNEDGAGLCTDRRGAMYAAVFDQAGGLGGVVRGAASEVAAKAAFRSFQGIARSGEAVDITARLEAAIDEAHRELIDRGEGEVTTAVLAAAGDDRVVIVNSGDSAALWFDEGGDLKAATEKHEVVSPMGVGCLVHAVGLVPEGPAPDAYEWSLQPGDWLLMGSDGLLDARLDLATVGRILAEAATPEAAVNRLARVILRRMTLLQAKPDNLTVVAIRVRRRPSGSA